MFIKNSFFLKYLFKDLPKDVNPSIYASYLALFGIITETLMGSLCTYEPTRLLGVLLTAGLHIFIMSMIPAASVMEWNIFCLWAIGWLFV